VIETRGGAGNAASTATRAGLKEAAEKVIRQNFIPHTDDYIAL
jgi:hypothetical protein